MWPPFIPGPLIWLRTKLPNKTFNKKNFRKNIWRGTRRSTEQNNVFRVYNVWCQQEGWRTGRCSEIDLFSADRSTGKQVWWQETEITGRAAEKTTTQWKLAGLMGLDRKNRQAGSRKKNVLLNNYNKVGLRLCWLLCCCHTNRSQQLI